MDSAGPLRHPHHPGAAGKYPPLHHAHQEEALQVMTVYSLQSTVYSLQSTVYSLQSIVYSLQSTVYSL